MRRYAKAHGTFKKKVHKQKVQVFFEKKCTVLPFKKRRVFCKKGKKKDWYFYCLLAFFINNSFYNFNCTANTKCTIKKEMRER